MRSLFAVTIWGTDYIDEFVKVTLPMHMASGNLRNFPDLESSTYLIHTKHEDLPYIKSLPQIHELSKLMNVEIVGNRIPDSDKYHALGTLQSKTFAKSLSENFEVVFPLYSDVLISAGTFSNCVKRLNSGYMAVVTAGPQAVTETLVPELLAPDRFWESSSSLSVPPRELVKLVFDNLHPFHAPSFWEPKLFTNVPSMIFFPVPGQGVLAHGFHLHPVALKVQDHPSFSLPFYGSLDENFIPIIFSSADYVYVAPDSDELFMCSTDSITAGRSQDAEGLPSISRVAAYAEAHAFTVHRDFINFPIRMHTGGINSAIWNPVEQTAQDIISRVNQRLSLSDKTLSIEDPTSYDNRIYHRSILLRMKSYQTSMPVGWGWSHVRFEVPIRRIFMNLIIRGIVTFRKILHEVLMLCFFWTPYILLGRFWTLTIGLTVRAPLFILRVLYRTLQTIYQTIHICLHWLPKPLAPSERHLVKKLLEKPPLNYLISHVIRFFTRIKMWGLRLHEIEFPRWFEVQMKVESILNVLLGKGLTSSSNRKSPHRTGMLHSLLDQMSKTYLDPLLKTRSTRELLFELLIRLIRPPRM